MIRPAVVLLSCAGFASAFTLVPSGPAATLRTSQAALCRSARRPPSSSSHVLTTVMAVDADAVKALVDKAEAADGPGTAPKKVSKALKKPTGALTVVIEYKNTEGNGKEGSLDFEGFSTNIRKDKAACVVADISTERGLAELEVLFKEQSKAKGNFPGPCPLIASGDITTLEMAAKAKAAGADGVYVPFSAAEGLLGGCHAIGLEVIVEVESESEVEAAIAFGAKMLCVAKGEDADGQVAMRGEIPKDVVALAALPGRAFGGPAALFEKEEAETAEDEDVAEILQAGFKLRDAKFNGIVVKEACTNADDREETTYARWLSSQLNSKRSNAYQHLAKVSSPLGTGGSRRCSPGAGPPTRGAARASTPAPPR
eukprot:CAMPEP_0169435322 /NCGR_PEP_ID=MMETSP1042-20121227/5002_1 /TAXON_ID=464988 /ORGANISM="Hemiselmis andersenii, Strain CCMP1180" /LENGTH=369 /DNA_ID=CAMNT_0009545959 /DNA_START=51 /DNA_END=1156 /DNA_ORIENTATION=+